MRLPGRGAGEAGAAWQVNDADTGEEMGRIEGDGREIELDLSENNARVLSLVRD